MPYFGGKHRTKIEFEFEPEVQIGSMSIDPVISPLPQLVDFIKTCPVCPDFKDLYSYLVNGVLPQDDRAARKILLMADEFTVEKGALYHLCPANAKTGQSRL